MIFRLLFNRHFDTVADTTLQNMKRDKNDKLIVHYTLSYFEN